MELMEWTDGKLEERLDRIDERFDEVNRRITETAATTNRRISETAETTYRRISEASAEADRRLGWVEEEVRGLKKGMQTLQGDIYRATIALWVGSAGIAAAILVKG